MPPVQERIIETLGAANGAALSMGDLVKQIRATNTPPSSIDIRAAVLPLINLQRVELTLDRKLRLR